MYTLFAFVVAVGGVGRAATAEDYLSGLRLLPADAAGVAWVADMPVLVESWKKTTLHELGQDDVMKPLVEANLGADGALWSKIGDKIGVRPKDLYEIASGEVVVGWLPFENDRRRPSCLCVIADTRGKHQQAIAVAERIDQDLKADGATRKDVEKFGETIRIYQPKTRPGQLKIEQVVISVTEDRVIASNRDSVVMDILEAIPQDGLTDSVEQSPLFQTVAKQVSDRMEVKTPGSTLQWYVRPLAMGRILRDVAKVDRGNKVKILNLLENQGFDAIQAMGGTVVVRQDEFDLLHRGYVHAPPVTDQPDRYRLAARVLQFPNGNLQELPGWIPKSTASVTQMNWKMEEAFWALESLVNEAFNDKIFRPTIAGIRDDEEGPQIDIEKNVMPNLGEHLLLLTDNTEPITVDSERLLVAIEVIDQDVIANAIEKAMEVEPDVLLVDVVEGVDIWKVQRGEGEIEEEAFFDDFGSDEDMQEEQPPLLDTWAIAMVGKGPGSDKPYLMFSSHVDFLVEIATRIQSGAGDGLDEQPEIVELLKMTQEFGGKQPSIQRVVRLRESLQAKYELQRRGELRDNDSVLATIIRRLFQADEQEEIQRPNATKWPPYSEVKDFFKNASSYVETTDTGWSLNAFLLH
ncbi:MAG: membrane or secreted protein [Rhodopirellula sp. JB044]|uniref:membrane or secreted protein n=1 Tax=Rhodopirellula sp. JB044 TaxID=3342844 RepID=UPI00370C06E6